MQILLGRKCFTNKLLFCNWQQSLLLWIVNPTELDNEYLALDYRSFTLTLRRQKPAIKLQHPAC